MRPSKSKTTAKAKQKELKIQLTYKQGLFLQSEADEVLFGGAAGG